MQSALERATGIYQDGPSRSRSPEHFISKPASLAVVGRGIGDNDHEVEVAVGAVVTTGFRAEEIDALRLVSLDQTLDDLRKSPNVLVFQVRQLTANPPLKLWLVHTGHRKYPIVRV
jgi:hypothetical protein